MKCKYGQNGACEKLFRPNCLDSSECYEFELYTNADRIRAMSDEELAERIWPKFGCPNEKNHVTCEYVGECKDCWMEWLQQSQRRTPDGHQEAD